MQLSNAYSFARKNGMKIVCPEMWYLRSGHTQIDEKYVPVREEEGENGHLSEGDIVLRGRFYSSTLKKLLGNAPRYQNLRRLSSAMNLDFGADPLPMEKMVIHVRSETSSWAMESTQAMDSRP